jgi:hypothetical protein
MGVPTITKIDKNAGPTGGRRLVKIWGGNFQLAPAPPLSGPAPVPNPSVEVLFGAVKAREVRVMAPSLLHVITPISDPGLVSVTVRNIDQAGAVIPGETVTVADAYTFARPELSNPEVKKRSNLTRLVMAVVTELRRQILDNTILATSTDYDDTPSGANVAALPSTPGLVLSGPFLRQNRFFATNQPRVENDGDGASFEQRPARTVDLAFTLIGVDDSSIRELDLMHECTAFFQRNTYLRMLRDPEVAETYVEYELDLESDGDFKQTGTANNSNIRAFSGNFVVRGFDVDDEDMAVIAAPSVQEVVPTGSASVGEIGSPPQPFIFYGQPGVTPRPPVQPPPALGPGNSGPIEQIPPEE